MQVSRCARGHRTGLWQFDRQGAASCTRRAAPGRPAISRPCPSLLTTCKAGKAPSQPQTTGGDASPDMLRMFGEAQRNIMELNRSRLAALEELKSARKRIAELEQQLAEARSQQAQQPQQAAPPAPAPQPLAQQAPSQPAPQPQYNGAGAWQPAQAPRPTTITVAYETGWGLTYLHYNVDGQGWTKSPGIPMIEGQGEMAGKKVLEVQGNRLEFVLNNGAGDWDTPDPSGGGNRNYVIDSAGRYRLKSGRLHRL